MLCTKLSVYDRATSSEFSANETRMRSSLTDDRDEMVVVTVASGHGSRGGPASDDVGGCVAGTDG